MRKAVIVVCGVVTAMALALPAQAKVEGSAFISGPGIPGGSGGAGDGGGGSIEMDGSDGGGYPVLSGMADPATYLTSRPKDPLGPRYEARLVITAPRGQPDVIQHLYPFARGGPVIYSLPGQEFVMSPTGEASAGWFNAPPELIRELQSRGLPETAPPATHPEDGPAAAAPPGASPTGWVLVFLAGLLVAGALASRRRAVARRAA